MLITINAVLVLYLYCVMQDNITDMRSSYHILIVLYTVRNVYPGVPYGNIEYRIVKNVLRMPPD